MTLNTVYKTKLFYYIKEFFGYCGTTFFVGKSVISKQ